MANDDFYDNALDKATFVEEWKKKGKSDEEVEIEWVKIKTMFDLAVVEATYELMDPENKSKLKEGLDVESVEGKTELLRRIREGIGERTKKMDQELILTKASVIFRGLMGRRFSKKD